jgi:hypothetical protein
MLLTKAGNLNAGKWLQKWPTTTNIAKKKRTDVSASSRFGPLVRLTGNGN